MEQDPLGCMPPRKPHTDERRRRLKQLLHQARVENLQIIADIMTGGNPLLAKDEEDRQDMLTKHRLVVVRLNALLERIDDYSYCEICGEPLELTRLEEYWAWRTCTSCNRNIDHKVRNHIAEAVDRGHLV